MSKDKTRKDEKKTILIVDDDSIVRHLLSIIVELAGHQYHTAVNGESALIFLDQHQIDLILLDVMMPGGMNGFEVCKKVKSNLAHQHIPIILVTALGDKKNRELALSAGAVAVLSKPFSNDALISLINHHLTQMAILT